MKSKFINKLWVDDDELFTSMKENYQSENEREFFEKILYKQEWECSLSNDLILSEKDNEDEIYIVRVYFEEYIVGKKGKVEEEHVMCLTEALALNLKEIGVLDESITLFEWLRRRDYVGVKYDNDFDYR